MRHKTGDKGDIGVAKAIADLIEKGYNVLTPVASTSPFDLVIIKDYTFIKIQVKYRTLEKGKLEAHFRRAVIIGSKASYRSMNDNECDLLCIYCPDTNKCYYAYKKDFGDTVILRVFGKSNKNTKFAKDYENV